ncbi:MAG: hypothetical protein E7522_05595 [Ruminococcaceae bacterium]|nr:hypothetical protein [Oscillospiraceae bacterium]
MNKKFISVFLIAITFLSIFISCNRNDVTNQFSNTNPITSENTSNGNWNFQKLAEESDCCLIIGVIQDEKENWNSKVVDGEYYSTFKLSKPQYIPQFLSFPDEITIIQKESAFLEKRKIGENVRFYIVFLNETEVDSTYYITGNTYGVIEIENAFNLVPLEKSFKSEINQKFPPGDTQEQFVIFKEWLTEEYYKDFEYTTVHYDNITF